MIQEIEMPLDELRDILVERGIDFEEGTIGDSIRFEDSRGYLIVAQNFGMRGVEISGALTPRAAANATLGNTFCAVRKDYPSEQPEGMTRYFCRECEAIWFQFEEEARFCPMCGARIDWILLRE